MQHQRELFLPEPLHGGHPEIEKQQRIADHYAYVEEARSVQEAESRLANDQLTLPTQDIGRQAMGQVIEFPQHGRSAQHEQKHAA